MRRSTSLISLAVCGSLLAVAAVANLAEGQPTVPATVEFNRDIRPILSDACFTCHGPDKARRKADLRLDTEAGAFADLDGTKVITPGKLDKSELYQRLVHTDPKRRMPPASTGRKLTEHEIQMIARWIEQGAKWQAHWSLISPGRPAKPQAANSEWVRNPIDAFILAKLQANGLSPSPEADRVTLVRRVTLDLTGLPPTPEEVENALSDKSPDWYEKVVDRLLASPRYGEHMAIRWLDAARYADTNGYQSDGERTMWRWRDWVIDAFNRNMPFDQFTIEQLAGDLLPPVANAPGSPASLAQKIATGFNRNHRGNAEGGIIPEEYAVEYVADRVETTATVWMGLTLTCCRCHDHKYDPIKQREFYQLFAFFNNVPERGKAIKYGNSPPMILSPTAEQQEQLDRLELQRTEADKRWRDLQPEIARLQAAWEKADDGKNALPWTPKEHLVAHFKLDDNTANEMPKPAAVFEDGQPAYGPGRLDQAAEFDGKRFINAGSIGEFGFLDKFTLAAWVYPKNSPRPLRERGGGEGTPGGYLLSRKAGTARAAGYSITLEAGKVHVNLVVRWLDDAIRVETERAIPPDRWHHIAVSYDGTRLASGVKVYIDGQPEKLKINLDDLNQSFKSKEPFRIGAGGTPENRFVGMIDDVRIYDAALSADSVAVVATPDSITDILALKPQRRSPSLLLKLRAYFLDQQAPQPIREAHRRLLTLQAQHRKLIDSLPTTMVMQEMPKPRDTFVLIRGEYDKHGDKVTAGVPAVFHTHGKLSVGLPNRLDLARWLVDPKHPLTARVAVNRYWQMFFGTGVVKTVDDFGSQGEWPSHPELLDWLATEFSSPSPQPAPARGEGVPGSPSPPAGEGGVRGWDIKRLVRLIVTSATYRQSSRVTKTLLEKDPENRLLARGPRYRLSAETIRDQALSASGLLVERVGGPSVRPYQPAGLWKDLVESAAGDYTADRGPSLYRRSLYTFWKRTVAPPGMMTFDAAGREFCQVRQSRTNTPLQALNLMNDVTYVEASRVLAERVMREAGPTPRERLTLAFRLLLARRPRPAELDILLGSLTHHRSRYQADPQAAMKLVGTGEYPRDPKLDTAELAAYTAVAGMILNLDEAITKE